MAILIGGAPSTGSSLLRQILNRHPAIYCGPETNLFAFEQLFAQWSSLKFGLVRKPLLKPPDFHLSRGAALTDPELLTNRAEVSAMLEMCDSFEMFYTKYFGRILERSGKLIWAEKTPANVLSFQRFLDAARANLCLHMVRDPLDVIASLCARGVALYVAVGRCLFNNAHALSASSENLFMMRYEELVENPANALSPLLERLNLQYDAIMITPGNTSMYGPDQLAGWRYSELEAPGGGSVGHFQRLELAEQAAIVHAVYNVELSKPYFTKRSLSVKSLVEVVHQLSYELPQEPACVDRGFLHRLRRQERRYKRFCWIRGHSFLQSDNPLIIKSD